MTKILKRLVALKIDSYPGPSHPFLLGWEGPGYEVTPETHFKEYFQS